MAVKTGFWFVDTFGPWGPLVTAIASFSFLVLYWVFLRPPLIAWVESDPALRKKRLSLVIGVGFFLVALSFVLIFSAG
jgi:hypothetical protein